MEQLIPAIGRLLERCIIAIGAIIIVYLGYRLFLHGTKAARTELSAKSKFVDFMLKGSAPGLFFMVCGSLILLCGLWTGKVVTEAERKNGATMQRQDRGGLSPEQQEAIKRLMENLSPEERERMIDDWEGIMEWLEGIMGQRGTEKTKIEVSDYIYPILPVVAPGAALLAAVGVCLVGWVRRRRKNL